jgi:hypothetical protein
MLDVKVFREECGVKAEDVVRTLREQYPGYDKYLNSKVEQPEKYGVRLVNDAERLLAESFQKTAQETRKPDRRRLPCRVQFRLSRGEFGRLQLAFRNAGYKTMQEGMKDMISRYLTDLADWRIE